MPRNHPVAMLSCCWELAQSWPCQRAVSTCTYDSLTMHNPSNQVYDPTFLHQVLLQIHGSTIQDVSPSLCWETDGSLSCHAASNACSVAALLVHKRRSMPVKVTLHQRRSDQPRIVSSSRCDILTASHLNSNTTLCTACFSSCSGGAACCHAMAMILSAKFVAA